MTSVITDGSGSLRLMGGSDSPDVPFAARMSKQQLAALAEFTTAIELGEIQLERIDECLCGSRELSQIATRERWGLPIGAHLCLDCGLVISSPRIAEESLSRYYEHYYDRIQLGAPVTSKTLLFQRGQGQKIFDLFRQRSADTEVRVMEIGCAAGSVLKEFCRAAQNFGIQCSGTGVDFNPQFVNAFDSEGMDIQVFHGGYESAFEKLPHPDLIILSHIFEHFNDPQRFLADLAEHCGNGTLIYIEVPGLLDLRRRPEYMCDLQHYLTCSHPYHYNLVSLTALLNRHGFQLCWGNEVVESFFRRGEQHIDWSGNGQRVARFLEDLEYAGPFYNDVQDMRQRLNTLERRVELAEQLAGEVHSFLPWRIYRVLRRYVTGK